MSSLLSFSRLIASFRLQPVTFLLRHDLASRLCASGGEFIITRMGEKLKRYREQTRRGVG
ncbi:hypothetical protein EDWATA_01572 [Edwardsiella tarda ATCC 23685]|uniref:Uncharacterized protein n=1 Tax=Edwardsiella tarda ATCC 23685 TaxID=500638 RepID=D4F4A2_EDWTA|nr:hypothetical protein EDWATA_01572 [Edwardsiella tarda ATCC 23685]